MKEVSIGLVLFIMVLAVAAFVAHYLPGTEALIGNLYTAMVLLSIPLVLCLVAWAQG